jgi:membrane-associated protease RseP (regulator of RpoE activity)
VTNAFAYILGVLFVLLGIAVSIGLHEIGHLVPAKLFGARVTKYMIGFGPTIFSRKRGETEYGIKAIPLGGYIAISGMFPPEKQGRKLNWFTKWVRDARKNQQELDGTYDERRAFYLLPIYQRVIVMLGGPTMNLFLGVIFATITLSGIGVNQTSNKIDVVFDCATPYSQTTTCNTGDPVGPAKRAGLLAGDRIVAVNGNSVGNWQPVADALAKSGSKPLQLKVKRGNRQLNITVSPVLAKRAVVDASGQKYVTDSKGNLVYQSKPVMALQLASERSPLGLDKTFEFSGKALGQTAGMIWDLPNQLSKLTATLFGGGTRSVTGPVSIVGISDIAGNVAQSNDYDLAGKLSTGFLMLSSLNFALFVFNLVPLLPLDGGHVLNALIEGVKRRSYKLLKRADPGPLDTAMFVPLMTAMWGILMLISLIVIAADFVRPVSLF